VRWKSPRLGPGRAAVSVLSALSVLSVLFAAAPARAQEAPAGLEAAAASPTPAVPPRPRMNIAIGVGQSFDATGFSPARTERVPAMFATGGLGADWPVGAELAVFASSAVGRYRGSDAPIDRLALDAVGVVRPLAWKVSLEDRRYRARLVRAAAIELGLGLERDGTTLRAGSRFGLHLGARLEVPLGPAGARSELRLRLGARRMQGLYTPRVGTVDVGDSVEIYAALVTIF
jgi:hypothetical protein